MRIYIRVWSAIKVFFRQSRQRNFGKETQPWIMHSISSVRDQCKIHADLEDLFSNFRPSVSTFNINLPATEIHASNSTPSLSYWIKYFNGIQALCSIVSANGIKSVFHHSHSDSWSEHWHCLCILPTPSYRIIDFYCTQGVARLCLTSNSINHSWK